MNPLATLVKEKARSLGFELVGIAPASEADDFARLNDWLERGFAGAMRYMARDAEARRHPSSILPTVRTVIMVGINYKPKPDLPTPPPARSVGRVARYAGGRDYHDVLREKLKALLAWIQQERPGTRGRGVVDTAPLLERDFARRAGLGWIAKNTMLIHKKAGSYFFLGALLIDLELPLDEPFDVAHCGSCTRCLDACPTDAFVGPYRLDARRCISYLTIELRGPIAEDLRSQMGDWIFGCDVCQEVCPWNRKSPTACEADFQTRLPDLDLVALMGLSEEEFREQFRHTALWRTGRSGLLRNAAIALGNRADANALPALEAARMDGDETVREAAGWAIAQIRHANGLLH